MQKSLPITEGQGSNLVTSVLQHQTEECGKIAGFKKPSENLAWFVMLLTINFTNLARLVKSKSFCTNTVTFEQFVFFKKIKRKF